MEVKCGQRVDGSCSLLGVCRALLNFLILGTTFLLLKRGGSSVFSIGVITLVVKENHRITHRAGREWILKLISLHPCHG